MQKAAVRLLHHSRKLLLPRKSFKINIQPRVVEKFDVASLYDLEDQDESPPLWLTKQKKKKEHMTQEEIEYDQQRFSKDAITVQEVVYHLEKEKSSEIRVLDVRNQCEFTEYIIIAMTPNERGVKLISQGVYRQFKHRPLTAFQENVLGIEGCKDDNWKVVDLGHIVIHVMTHSMNERYQLEHFWTEERRKKLEEERIEEY